MRTLLRMSLVLGALAFTACEDSSIINGPPLERLYFPAGLAHLKVPGRTNGVLVVANANANKLYQAGSVVALDLDTMSELPPMGGLAEGLVNIQELGLHERQSALIASFASGVHMVEVEPGARWRVYVPTRSERNRIYQLELTFEDGAPVLSCVGAEGQNCLDTGLSLTPREFEFSSSGIPRAPQPYAITSQVRACTSAAQCCPADAPDCGRACAAGACVGRDSLPLADLWVTHAQQADSPNGSGLNLRSYVVHVESDDFDVNELSFVPIGFGATNSAVAYGSWVYLSGRIVSPSPNLLRMVSSDATTLISSGLESAYRVSDARSLVLSSNKKRFYMVGRAPDSLLVTNLYNADSSLPSVAFARAVPLIDAANEAQVISRAGRGDLVAITGSAINAGTLAIYDDDVGEVVAVINGIGSQPAYIALDHRGSSARLYLSNFLDGRIAIVDIPDLARPQSARLVGHLGRQQACLVTGTSSPSCIASGEMIQ